MRSGALAAASRGEGSIGSGLADVARVGAVAPVRVGDRRALSAQVRLDTCTGLPAVRIAKLCKQHTPSFTICLILRSPDEAVSQASSILVVGTLEQSRRLGPQLTLSLGNPPRLDGRTLIQSRQRLPLLFRFARSRTHAFNECRNTALCVDYGRLFPLRSRRCSQRRGQAAGNCRALT